MSGDTYTVNKFEWLDRVLSDAELTPSTFKIAYLIATRYLSRADGKAWPSYKTLAKAIGISEKSAMRAVSELEDRGHLEVTQRGNVGKSNVYMLAVASSPVAEGCSPVTPDMLVTPDKSVTPTLTDLSPSPGQNCPPNPLNEPSEEPSEEEYSCAQEPKAAAPARESAKPSLDWKRSFQEFYDQYGHKVARADAERAYRKALDDATPEEILAGVMRYAAHRTALIDAGQFCAPKKNPATWLNKKCWLDEPDPVVKPVSRSAGSHSDRKAVASDVAQRLKGLAHDRRNVEGPATFLEASRMRVIG